MQWWNDLISWLTSSAARPTVYAGIVLFVAVLAAGLLAAWIASAAIRRVVAQRDRESKTAAIAALVDAATEASVWNSLTPQEQVLADRAVGQADILVRLLPIRGSDVAANWAAHQLHELKRASATFGYQLDPAVVEFRDRLLEWQRRPSRTRKQFQNDLVRWRSQRQEPEQVAVEEQDAWVAEQHHERYQSAATLDDRAARHRDTAPDADARRRPRLIAVGRRDRGRIRSVGVSATSRRTSRPARRACGASAGSAPRCDRRPSGSMSSPSRYASMSW